MSRAIKSVGALELSRQLLLHQFRRSVPRTLGGVEGREILLAPYMLQGSPSAPTARRLDGRSKALLAASIKALPYEMPGWITNKEAKQLFSPMNDEYAFGEMDEVGKSNIADFAAHVTPPCSFAFMPVEGRVYFSRKADDAAGGRS